MEDDMPLQVLRGFSWLFQNPIARFEFNHLQRSRRSRWGRLLKGVLIGLALGIAAVPFLIYLRPENRDLFMLSAVAILICSAWIEVEILSLACNAILRERNAWTWELLLVTGCSSRNFVFGKWQAVVCRMWKSIILFALLRLGIAYGLMQYLNIYPTWIDAEVNSFNVSFY
jgi:ABC-type transport system involved in multi-copper enzyme maturation permease subunit